MTADQLMALANALNEVCHGSQMDDTEFEIRIGVTRQEARLLLDQVNQALDGLAAEPR